MAGSIDNDSPIYDWEPDGVLNPVHDLWHDGHACYANGQDFSEMVTEYTGRYIRQAATEAAPFLLDGADHAPDYPMHAPQNNLDRFPDRPWDRQIMAAMLSAVDDGVGSLCEELERQGIWDNTWIFFQSDHGPSHESRNWLDGRAPLANLLRDGGADGHAPRSLEVGGTGPVGSGGAGRRPGPSVPLRGGSRRADQFSRDLSRLDRIVEAGDSAMASEHRSPERDVSWPADRS